MEFEFEIEFGYITNEQIKTIKQIIKTELENGTSPKFLIGCIYDLYQNYLISEVFRRRKK